MGSGTEILAFTVASNTCKKQLAQVGARLGPALLCASERGARYRCVLGSQHYSFGEGLTGSRHLHHLAMRRGGRAAGRLAGPGRRDACSRRGVSGTGRRAHVMDSSPEELGLFSIPWRRPWPMPCLTGLGKTARMAYFRALIWLNLL